MTSRNPSQHRLPASVMSKGPSAQAFLDLGAPAAVRPAKSKKKPSGPLVVPPWVSAEAWEGFVEMRGVSYAPLSPEAARRILLKLEKLRNEGEDPNKVLDQSVMYGWRGVFPVKPKDY